MRPVSFNKAFKNAIGTILWSLNYLLLIIPIFLFVSSGTIDADTSFVAFLSICLTAFGGVMDLYEKNELSMWLTSPRRLALHNSALISLYFTVVLSFASAISASKIVSLACGSAVIYFIFFCLIALITPYLLVRLSVSYQLFLFAKNGSISARPLVHDYIRPMLRKLDQ